MSRRGLLTSMIFMIAIAIAGAVVPPLTHTKPNLGLDLQGGVSVVLQAVPVDGELPSENAVEGAKEIIRQRVDGMGVAEPDITRQGRTVVVQLPGLNNSDAVRSQIGCTGRLEFRPVLAQAANPGSSEPPSPLAPTTTTAATSTTAGEGAATTIEGAPSTTEAPAGDVNDEQGGGTVGLSDGEGALPAQFKPTTTTGATTTTEAPPTTVATTTTVDPASTTTTVPGEEPEVPGPKVIQPGEAGACGSGHQVSQETADVAFPGQEGLVVSSKEGGVLYLLGPTGFTGEALSSAEATIESGQWQVLVNVKGSQRTKANEAFNACAVGDATCPPSGTGPGSIAIVLDGEVLSAPAVNSTNLADKEFTISGSFTESEAKDLALVLRYGSLPVVFEQAALQQVSATLGSDSLRAGMIAGFIGIGVLALYMILYYRGFGMTVVASLLVWMAAMYGLVCFLSESQGLALTLAGITGIIVSVGTTVDTYVVVFERVKDEIRGGRSVRAATERGYESGIKTVLTANGAAFIGAFLLWWLTVGPVRGFAYFLGLSVILDLAVAILFTRPLILLLSRSPKFASNRFFGIGTATDQKNLVRRSKATTDASADDASGADK